MNDTHNPDASLWLVMNIGCIECGVSSKVVGVFADEQQAERVADQCQKHHDWREGGQNSYEVFQLPAVGVIDPEYTQVEA